MIDREIMARGGEILTVLQEAGPASGIVLVSATAVAFIERQSLRGKCVSCDFRRVLYRIGLRAIGNKPEFTEARCAECWYMTPEQE